MCLIIPTYYNDIKAQTIAKIKKTHKKSFIYGYKILFRDFWGEIGSIHRPYIWDLTLKNHLSSRLSANVYGNEKYKGEIEEGFHFFLKYKDANKGPMGDSFIIVRFKIPLDKIVAFGLNSADVSEGVVATECFVDKRM